MFGIRKKMFYILLKMCEVARISEHVHFLERRKRKKKEREKRERERENTPTFLQGTKKNVG